MMVRARLRLVVAVSVLVAPIVAGCGGGDGAPPAAPPRVAVVLKGLDNPFFEAMKQGVDAAAAAHAAEVTVQAATDITDVVGQAGKLSAMVRRGYDCFVVNPINGVNLVDALVPLARKGVPIVNVDSPIAAAAARTAGLQVATYVGTDNTAIGRAGARAMSTALGGRGGSIVLVGGFPGDAGSTARLGGFRAAAAGYSLRVVRTVAADFDFDRARAAAARALHDLPTVDGFFAANDVMALGIGQAVQAGRRPAVKVIGVDGIADALQAVKAGTLTATVSQYPFVIGQLGVEACLAASRGHPLPAKVDAPVQVVIRSNVDTAIANFPRPVGPFDDPFAALLRD